MNETLDPFTDLDERTERHELGDPPVDELTDAVARGELLPRILLGGLQRQADAFAIEIDLKDLDIDLVADGDDRRRVIDVLPRQLRDVHEAVHAAEVHEGAEVDDAGHHALATLAGLEVVEERATLFLLGLFEPAATAEHHIVAVLVELDDLGLDLVADVRLEIADSAELDE